MRRCSTALTAGLVLVLAFGSDALAQRGPTPKPPEKPAVKAQEKGAAKAKTKPATKEAAPVPPPPAPQVVMPDADKIVLLLRNTLITLNDAIQTGNFTVMRDKSAPGFREANSAARLGQIFSDLARSGADLSVVSVITPQLTETPVLDQAKGMLNIKGYFPTGQQQINFEMLYQSVDGRWRLFGLSVQPPAPAAPAPPAASPPAPSTPQTSSGNGGAPQSQP
jgi:hypothetical protein